LGKHVHVKHDSFSIDLDDVICAHCGHSEELAEGLTFLLSVHLSSPKNCKACGGILPELGFKYEGKEYRFTCFEIRDEKGKVIATTDYKQMGRWCKYFASKADKEKKKK
jgi:hypothetical protein